MSFVCVINLLLCEPDPLEKDLRSDEGATSLHASMSTLRSSVPFDPAGPVPTTTSLESGSGRLNQYTRQLGGQLFSTPQTQVSVYTDDNNNGQEVVSLNHSLEAGYITPYIQVIKAVKKHNATRDKFQMLRRNHQARKGDLLSTEQSIRREIAIMKACRHANVVRLVEVLDDPRKDKVYMGECQELWNAQCSLIVQ